MITSTNSPLKVNFNWTRNFSILIFLIAVVAEFGNTLARIESLDIEAGVYYQPYLSHILHQYKKTEYFKPGNQFNTVFPLTFTPYPHSTD